MRQIVSFGLLFNLPIESASFSSKPEDILKIDRISVNPTNRNYRRQNSRNETINNGR